MDDVISEFSKIMVNLGAMKDVRGHQSPYRRHNMLGECFKELSDQTCYEDCLRNKRNVNIREST